VPAAAAQAKLLDNAASRQHGGVDVLVRRHVVTSPVYSGSSYSLAGRRRAAMTRSAARSARACRVSGAQGRMSWSINWDASNGYNFADTVAPYLATLP